LFVFLLFFCCFPPRTESAWFCLDSRDDVILIFSFVLFCFEGPDLRTTTTPIHPRDGNATASSSASAKYTHTFLLKFL
jgi:hypothetical protein